MAQLLNRNGVVVLVAAVSPYSADRAHVRAEHDSHDLEFVEVYVKASVDICRQRDPKGLYRLSDEGKIHDLTGVGSPYEPPVNPDIVLDTERNTALDCALSITNRILG